MSFVVLFRGFVLFAAVLVKLLYDVVNVFSCSFFLCEISHFDACSTCARVFKSPVIVMSINILCLLLVFAFMICECTFGRHDSVCL